MAASHARGASAHIFLHVLMLSLEAALAMATPASDQEQLLKLLVERGSFDSYDLSQELVKDHQAVVGTIKSLHSLGEVRMTTLYLNKLNMTKLQDIECYPFLSLEIFIN